MRLRSLLWLIAMAAFVLPSLAGTAIALDRAAPMAMSGHVMTDCGHEAPPPCPEKNTAQHAAGLCCPLMAGAVALLPPIVTALATPQHLPVDAVQARHLTGLSPHQDPPPPRV